LLSDVVKSPLRAREASRKAFDFLWEIYTSDLPYNLEILEMALEIFSNLIKSWELKNERQNILEKCI